MRLPSFFLLLVNAILFFSCNNMTIDEMSYEESKKYVKQFLYIENNRYVLKLSKEEAIKVGISIENYNRLWQLNEEANIEIEKWENTNSDKKLYLYDYQKKLCFSIEVNPENFLSSFNGN